MKIAIIDLETTGFMPKGLIVEVGDDNNHPFDSRKILVAVKGTDNKTHVVLGHVSHFATCPNADEHSLN